MNHTYRFPYSFSLYAWNINSKVTSGLRSVVQSDSESFALDSCTYWQAPTGAAC